MSAKVLLLAGGMAPAMAGQSASPHELVALLAPPLGSVLTVTERASCTMSARIVTRVRKTGTAMDAVAIAPRSFSAEVERIVTFAVPTGENALEGSVTFAKAAWTNATGAETRLATQAKTYPFAVKKGAGRKDVISPASTEEAIALDNDRLISLLLSAGQGVAERRGEGWTIAPLGWRALFGAYLSGEPPTACRGVSDSESQLVIECKDSQAGSSATVRVEFSFGPVASEVTSQVLKAITERMRTSKTVREGEDVETVEVTECVVEGRQAIR